MAILSKQNFRNVALVVIVFNHALDSFSNDRRQPLGEGEYD